MLNFLRKVRKSLIGSNNTKKYILYAIGEIALVVIGILIALQINNWNEWKKDRKDEQIILYELKENLKENLQILEHFISRSQYRIVEIDWINQYIETNSKYNDSLGVYLEKLNYIDEFELLSSAYESLNSQGFDLISSNTLKKEIIDLYEFEYSKAMKLIDRVDFSRFESDSEFFLENFIYTNDFMIPNNYGSLRSNQLFKNILFRRQSWKKVRKIHMEGMLESTRQLLHFIQKEMDEEGAEK